MIKPKVLHVACLDKFIPPFIDFVEVQKIGDGHLFCISGDESRFPVNTKMGVMRLTSLALFVKGLPRFVRSMNCSGKIILHGLFDWKVLILLFLQPWILKKCYWVIWGGDLYAYEGRVKSWRWRIKEFLRRPVIKNLGHLVTFVPGDVELARRWYGAKGRYHECFMYLSNVYYDRNILSAKHCSVNIQVGNSADPSNEHIEILTRLAKFAGEDIKIYAPLSYGGDAYAKDVVTAGKNLFGEKFIPLLGFMAFEDYLAFLASIDVAVFNHRRQQAMGNTISLLGMGKKVYLREDVSTWDVFKRRGIEAYSLSDLSLTTLDADIASRNRALVLKEFSEEALKMQLTNIFKD
ncbi:TDP-N-acetylfucosamine:lipid II N-acetylfucosaminyltransferase [Pseudomonas sp. BT-42-2]|uniref:TDP-N-acetylfucosamine:lipid II N-acetylfucosaminyltransferase n=1 Tax=Pseudomonas sp. BT-42-2 TaxID=2986927 RepID=UPI0021F7F3B8|nr:TDP-N-acetylfucosamine:lipid II N-acetylfucosaminyltransferase [Pseudomonas sp. BT-42-2]MCV9917826.1 TDP-N-acetylfucosamine:lipid II N-acetylfucosaminyltransferase [Pseudomonas sp. BT-42-2]